MSPFVSTRGGAASATFAQALFQGLAPDGGLYVPERLPALPDPGAWSGGAPRAAAGATEEPADFTDSALRTARALMDGMLDASVLAEIVRDALDAPVPLVEVEEGVHVLELFHGPSLAFKDVGARFMARAMKALDPADGPRTVLVATSGDTGGAVASAFHGLEGYRVVALFPRDGVSRRQRRQMTTLGGNVVAAAVGGTFDDCQRMAKEAFADAELRDGAGLTSANSINVGRLLPQAFYYAHAARLLARTDDAPPRFVVPSGNLGNLCAGLLAHRAGMPAAGFVAACNRNRVFVDYLETGTVEPTPSVPTVSNAMDVGDPSNLERIRWLYGDDAGALGREVIARSRSDDDTRRTIGETYERTGYLLDPHTAVGWSVAEDLAATDGPTVVLATAHPAKFPDVVAEATGGVEPPVPSRLSELLAGEETFVTLAPEASGLRDLILDGTPS